MATGGNMGITMFNFPYYNLIFFNRCTVCARRFVMPRVKLKPVPQGKRKRWDEENMAKAVSAIREKKMKLMEAARHFEVPKSTLFRLSLQTDVTAKEAASKKLGRKPILPSDLEKELVRFLLIMEKKFYGLTRNDVRRMAFQLAERNKIPHPFSNTMAGRAWFDHFMSKFKNELSVRKPTATSIAPVSYTHLLF